MANKWMQHASERMKKKGTKGSFSRIADRMGLSTKQAADRIMAHPDSYSKSTRKKANFARSVLK